MKRLFLAGALALGGCATTGTPPVEYRTRDVVVTRTEKAITEQQVRQNQPPAPLGPRPADTRSAADLLLAKVCEYVGFAEKADLMNQQAAGMSPVKRVLEPICTKVAAK